MDTSSLGQTMAVVGFHRKYMKHVFTSEELDLYHKLCEEAKVAGTEVGLDTLKQLEELRATREGVVELKPYGIDKEETIRVLSYFGDKELEKTKQTRH